MAIWSVNLLVQSGRIVRRWGLRLVHSIAGTEERPTINDETLVLWNASDNQRFSKNKLKFASVQTDIQLILQSQTSQWRLEEQTHYSQFCTTRKVLKDYWGRNYAKHRHGHWKFSRQWVIVAFTSLSSGALILHGPSCLFVCSFSFERSVADYAKPILNLQREENIKFRLGCQYSFQFTPCTFTFSKRMQISCSSLPVVQSYAKNGASSLIFSEQLSFKIKN